MKKVLFVVCVALFTCILHALPEVRQNYNPSNYTTPGQIVDPGAYDEEGHCIYARVVVEHAGLLRCEYQDRPDLAGQGMPKKKKKSAWKTFIEDNPKKYCDEEDVKEEKCGAWHKKKNERVEMCERLLKESWGEDALNWYKVAIDIRHHVRMLVQVVGIMGGPEGAVGATLSEYAWSAVDIKESMDAGDYDGAYGKSGELYVSTKIDHADSVIRSELASEAKQLGRQAAELGTKGEGNALSETIRRYGPGKAGNFHNPKIDAKYNNAVATQKEIRNISSKIKTSSRIAKAMPYISIGQINVDYGNDLAMLDEMEKQHGEGYRRCVEAINELKNCRCPVCGSL